jgi:hypothetical protein
VINLSAALYIWCWLCIIRPTCLDIHTAISLKQQSTGRHVTTLRHTILIPWPTCLCSYPTMLCAKQKSNKQQYYSIWIDMAGGWTHNPMHLCLKLYPMGYVVWSLGNVKITGQWGIAILPCNPLDITSDSCASGCGRGVQNYVGQRSVTFRLKWHYLLISLFNSIN